MDRTIRFFVLLVVLTLAGCEEDRDLANLAQKTNQQQAEQNQEMAKLNREVAEGSKRLVQAGAETTEKVLAMQQQLQEQRGDVEAEQKQLAQDRKADSVLGPALVAAASLAAVCLPLVLCWYLLQGLRRDPEADVGQLLLDEITQAAEVSPALGKSAPQYQHRLEL
jgi:hypothetical protein